MVIYDNYTTEEGVERVLAYSDNNVYIKREDEEYSNADDFAWQDRKYTETDRPAEGGTTDIIIQQKAAAFDYLTGRSTAND